METLSLPIVRIVRENIAVLLTHALSRAPLEEIVQTQLSGEFKQFRETAFALSEQRAERACVELALLLRYLDDEQGLSESYEGHSRINFGYVTKGDGTIGDLKLRDVANKVIHARGFEWDTRLAKSPKLICLPREDQLWKSASIDVVALSVVCGSLIG